MKKILIVGIGSIGKRYLKILTKKKVKIGVFDKKTITFKDKKILVFNNFSEIKDWSPHGVIISTNTDSHLKILFRFKYFKTKFFLIEKPIAIQNKKISNLKFFSKNYNKKIYVVSNLRYFYNLNLIKKFLKKLGNPISAKSYFGHNLLKQKSKNSYYYKSTKYWGGIIYDCVHEVDLMLFLFGKVKNVICKNLKLFKKINSFDYSEILLEHENKVQSSITLDFLRNIKQKGFEIVCQNGTISWKSYFKLKNINNLEIIKFISNKPKKIAVFNNRVIDPNKQYEIMIDDYINIIKFSKSKNSLLSTMDEGISAVETIKKCYQSNKSKKLIRIR